MRVSDAGRGAMRRMARCAGWALAIALHALPAGAADLPRGIARALAAAGIPASAAAFYVHEIGAARPVLAVGADRAMNPASTIKLVTTYAGLELLGPAYRWSTEAYLAGPLGADGVLAGDLVLKGRGDPKITLEDFWLLLRSLRARGLREIRGDLVLDRSFFAPARHDPGGIDQQPTRPYNTAPDALLVNFKAVRLQFVPQLATRSVRVLVEPPLPNVEVVNRLALDPAGACGDWVSKLGLEARGDARRARLALNGVYAAHCGEQERHFSVLGHAEYVLALFRELWRELGGTLAGAARDGAAAPPMQLFATHESAPLAEAVRDINKYSNNVMARQLFLAFSAVTDPPGSPEKSLAAIRHWLAGKRLAFPELVIENGSGLSRRERISARHLGELLIEAFRSPVMPELVASLPVAATDGTMKKRLKQAAIAGRAHLKTGSLAGVRALAGYVLDARGRRVAVVFFVNHANAGNAEPVQDALLEWVYRR